MKPHNLAKFTLMKTIRSKKIAISSALAITLSACSFGPDYVRPKLELPVAPSMSAATAQVTPPSWWQVFQDANLDKLVDEALANNNNLLAAAARVTEAATQFDIASADGLPSVYAAAGSSRNRNSEKSGNFQANMPLETTTNKASLNVSWELDFWGKFRRATEAARADLLSNEANRDALRLSITSQTAQGYIALVSLDAQLVATQHGLQRAKQGFEMQKKRFDAGVASEFEYRQREAEYDAALAQLPPVEDARARQERALLVLLGRSPKAILSDKIDRISVIKAPQMIPSGIPSTLIINRPDVREAEQKLVAANARIGVARATYFPSISLTGSFGGESASLADLFSGPARTWRFAGDLTQALWGAGRLMSQTAAVESRNTQAEQNYRATVANAFREVADALGTYTRSRAVADAETRRVTSLNKTWELAKLRFEHGVSSQLDVIDTERGLLLAEFDRIAADRDLKLAIVDFYRALGGTSGGDIMGQ